MFLLLVLFHRWLSSWCWESEEMDQCKLLNCFCRLQNILSRWAATLRNLTNNKWKQTTHLSSPLCLWQSTSKMRVKSCFSPLSCKAKVWRKSLLRKLLKQEFGGVNINKDFSFRLSFLYWNLNLVCASFYAQYVVGSLPTVDNPRRTPTCPHSHCTVPSRLLSLVMYQ